MSTDTLPRLLTAAEVAAQTGLPLSRIYELAREGSMPSIRFGRALRFSAPALLDWIAAGGTDNGSGSQPRGHEGQGLTRADCLEGDS